MPEHGERGSLNVLRRIGLWFASLLLAVALFCLFFSLIFMASPFFTAGSILPVLRVTMIFALPVWCLYLPVVIAVKDAEERRIWTILLTGTLIGPLAMFLWSLILLLRGFSQKDVWLGDPLLGGLGGCIGSMTLALIVGFLTTSFYVIALKILHRVSTASSGRFV
ncbi:MAG TPA: hypothetical protein VE178_01395 [Silvibacterium sp.]|nr:hypothetical protein [Silvibacterium sp.]